MDVQAGLRLLLFPNHEDVFSSVDAHMINLFILIFSMALLISYALAGSEAYGAILNIE